MTVLGEKSDKNDGFLISSETLTYRLTAYKLIQSNTQINKQTIFSYN